jgi:hypothetical protein
MAVVDMKLYLDPREQPVRPCTPASIEKAKRDAAHEVVHAEIDVAGPQSVQDILRRAGTPPLEDDICIGCGVQTRLHRSLSGVWIGCAGALKAGTPLRNPERWNDPYPAVTCEVRKALLTECGPVMEIHCARYTHDELLAVAHALAKATIAAYTRELAK